MKYLKLLVVSLFSAIAMIPGASIAGDALTCNGYPEPRVFLESQGWWTDTETLADGDTQHAHSGVCFPLAPTVVSGTVSLDIVSKLHNTSGFNLRRVRIQDSIDQGPLADIANVYPGTVCNANDCTFITTLTINTDSLATGMHELRLQTSIESPVAGKPQLLATNGYQLCVRSCSGVTPGTTDHPEGRGWYRNEHGIEIGYTVARFNNLAAFPFAPVSSTWCVPIRTGRGFSGDVRQERSRVVVDPNFHEGNPGRTYLDVAEEFQGNVCIDTTELTNGLHKLVLISYSTSSFPGQLWGVLVVPFNVDNSSPPPPPPLSPQCSDGIDNDIDGRIDMIDRQCRAPTDNDEKRR